MGGWVGGWVFPLPDQRLKRILMGALCLVLGTAPRVVIEEPQDGGDLVFEALHDKSWTVRATIDNFKMGVDVGYACVFLDGLYKGCSVDANLVLVFDDPGLDYTWHLLEVRLLDAQDQQVAPSVLAEFRAGVRPCSVPITEHITSLVAQGLAWQHQVMGTSSDITCVSSLREALHSSVHMTVTPEPEEEEEESYLAHATLWADEESLAAVMPFANYRRWRRQGAMSSRNVSVSLAKQHQPLLLHNATIYYPGLVLAPSAAAGLQFADRVQAEGGDRVLYNLRGPCDDRNLVAVVPSGPGMLDGELAGAIVVQQIWGDSFYHWMIECLPRLAAIPGNVLHNASVALLVPALDGFINESLSLLGIHHSRLRALMHDTYYIAQDVWLPPPGVCGLGPATRLLRRMNSLLRLELVRREAQEENEENVRKCLVVQRKDGGGRDVTNHDEFLRALHLLPSWCAGRWQVGCLWHRSWYRVRGGMK